MGTGQGEAHGGEPGVPPQPKIQPLLVPELREGGIEVHVHANRNAGGRPRQGELTGQVHQQVARSEDPVDAGVFDRLAAVEVQQGGPALQPEFLHHGAEVAAAGGGRQGLDAPAAIHRFDQADPVAQLGQTEHPLQDRPRRAPLPGDPREHSADHDVESTGHPSPGRLRPTIIRMQEAGALPRIQPLAPCVNGCFPRAHPLAAWRFCGGWPSAFRLAAGNSRCQRSPSLWIRRPEELFVFQEFTAKTGKPDKAGTRLAEEKGRGGAE